MAGLKKRAVMKVQEENPDTDKPMGDKDMAKLENEIASMQPKK